MASKSSKKKVAAPQLKVGSLTDTKNLKLRTQARRGSMYDAIYKKMAELKEGKSFTVPVTKGVSIRTLQNRMNAAIRRGPVEAPKGCVFRKYTTSEGEIAIACIKTDDRRFRGAPKAKAVKAKSKPKAKAVKKVAKKSAPKKSKKVAKKKTTTVVKTEVATTQG